MSQLTIAELQQENTALKEKVKALSVQRQMDRDREESMSTNHMAQLLEVLPAGVVIINSLGIVDLSNPAAKGLLSSPLDGHLWRDVVDRSFAPQADDGHEVSLKDGRRVAISTSALLGNQGQLVLLTNLTETRMLQDRLAHSQRLSEVGKMMASLAHQIRTPLSAALLYVSNLTAAEISEQHRIKFSSKAKTRLLNIEQQINDMLIFAKDNSQLPDVLSVEALFQSLEDALDVPLSQYDVDCDLVVDCADVVIHCNKEVLVGAIVNVVINALQAAKSNGSINISAKQIDSKLQLAVEDDGPGMAEELLLKVQQPFYTTKAHGTGLGISVAQVVAQAHNGTFELKSKSGVGTVAIFCLPIQ